MTRERFEELKKNGVEKVRYHDIITGFGDCFLNLKNIFYDDKIGNCKNISEDSEDNFEEPLLVDLNFLYEVENPKKEHISELTEEEIKELTSGAVIIDPKEEKNKILERQLKILNKALELAVETMRYELGRDAIKNLYKEALDNLSSNLNMKFDIEMCEWFIEQAKEMMKSEHR